MKRSNRVLLGGLLLAATVGFLIYSAVSETSVYYMTITEFTAQKETLTNEGVRVAGRVSGGSVQWEPKTLDLKVALADFEAPNGALPVHYNGILPDMFAEGRDVIVEGKYGTDGIFRAHTIMTSCPSKYQAEATADGRPPTS